MHRGGYRLPTCGCRCCPRRRRRVTTPEVLEVVCDSFAEVNAAICAAIGPDAVGLFGDEIGLAAEHVPELGLVGRAIPSAPRTVLAVLVSNRGADGIGASHEARDRAPHVRPHLRGRLRQDRIPPFVPATARRPLRMPWPMRA